MGSFGINKETIALICLVIVVVLYSVIFFKRGGEIEGFKVDDGNGDDYDADYCKIYERVFNDKGYCKHNIKTISDLIGTKKGEFDNNNNKNDGKNDEQKDDEYSILEAGCGVGADTALIKELMGKNVVSVDKSRGLMKIFQYNFPQCKSKLADLNYDKLFSNNQFDIVLALHNTLYHNKPNNIGQIVKNFSKWLKPNGILVIHLYDKKKLDPAPREFSQYYTNKSSGNRHSLTHFDAFIHDAFWSNGEKDDEKDVMYYNEKVVFRKSGNVKKMKHKLYFLSGDVIRGILKDNGFKFVKEIGLSDIQVEDAILGVYKKTD